MRSSLKSLNYLLRYRSPIPPHGYEVVRVGTPEERALQKSFEDFGSQRMESHFGSLKRTPINKDGHYKELERISWHVPRAEQEIFDAPRSLSIDGAYHLWASFMAGREHFRNDLGRDLLLEINVLIRTPGADKRFNLRFFRTVSSVSLRPTAAKLVATIGTRIRKGYDHSRSAFTDYSGEDAGSAERAVLESPRLRDISRLRHVGITVLEGRIRGLMYPNMVWQSLTTLPLTNPDLHARLDTLVRNLGWGVFSPQTKKWCLFKVLALWQEYREKVFTDLSELPKLLYGNASSKTQKTFRARIESRMRAIRMWFLRAMSTKHPEEARQLEETEEALTMSELRKGLALWRAF